MDPKLGRMAASLLAVLLLLLERGMFSSPSPPPALLEKVFQYIDLHQDEFVQTLKEWVAIESDSVQPVPRFRQELFRMMAVAADTLQRLGARVASVDMGPQQDLPVNIKFIIEGMEEAGSVALEELVEKEKDRFFSGVDYIVISDNLWISQRKPAITYGTRGNSYFMVEVKCRDQDFHSGTFGGILHEPMADLVALLGSLVDSSGHILVPGIYDEVVPLTEEEINTYKAIHLDLEEYRNSSRVEKFLFDTKEEILMHLWRYPSLSIHGIEGAFDEPGTKTVIPGRVIGKFSIRLVPHMNVSAVEKQVTRHLEDVFSKRNSSNKMVVSMTLGLHPWIANIDDTQYLAAKRAIRTVFGTEPDMIRDGSTIPIAKMFQEIVHKSVVLIPLGAVDDGEHSQNEKINRWNYIEGTKLFAAFFLEMAQLH
ncbi:carnosine dipeptidase 1 (metallopeptidase M20 family), isoform CRA_a [Homo sapiens]|nr:carnosine dipeptidase 1 (metallopeptidase M20 family), isoform CRA_a [Homo sapiens]